MQVVDVLDHPALERAGDADVVDDRQVLHELAQADAAGVRADRDAGLGRHEEHREDLVHAAEAAGVDLAYADRLGLQELLEHDPVVDMLAGRDADRRHRAGDRRVAEDVVGAGRLLDPVRVERLELAHPADRLADVPALVGVDREHPVGPISSRMMPPRRMSSATSAPTFILKRVQPSASASRQSRRTLSSG